MGTRAACITYVLEYNASSRAGSKSDRHIYSGTFVLILWSPLRSLWFFNFIKGRGVPSAVRRILKDHFLADGILESGDGGVYLGVVGEVEKAVENK